MSADGFGRANATLDGYSTVEGYVDKYLTENQFPVFKELTDAHVEGDHLLDLLYRVFTWVAETKFYTTRDGGQGTVSVDTKLMYIGKIKTLFYEKFKRHSFWKEQDPTWWTDYRARFTKHALRHADGEGGANTAESRKTGVLLRDVSKERGLLRAKLHGLPIIDAKTVATSMFEKAAQDRKSINDLLEFNVCRSAIARGGEHLFMRWPDTFWDYYFSAPDFDWRLAKTQDSQCMLFFHDYCLYVLDTFFSFGLFFMFGGLRRNSTMNDACKPYVFPYLHSYRKDYVATRLSKAIRNNLPPDATKDQERANSSKAIRRGGATTLAVHPDISPDERYCRLGHSGGKSGEIYVEAAPVANAVGGKAQAGYKDCHKDVFPPDFAVLGQGANVENGPVQQFVTQLFGHDDDINVEEFKERGKLRPMLYACAASIVRYYGQITSDFEGKNHLVICAINEAAMKAGLDDPLVALVPDGIPRWRTVLNAWSKKISEDFDNRNADSPPDNATIAQKVDFLVQCQTEQGNQLHEMKQKMEDRMPTNETYHLLLKDSAKKDAIIELLAEQNKLLKEQNELKQQQLQMSMVDCGTGGAPNEASADNGQEDSPASKKRKASEIPATTTATPVVATASETPATTTATPVAVTASETPATTTATPEAVKASEMPATKEATTVPDAITTAATPATTVPDAITTATPAASTVALTVPDATTTATGQTTFVSDKIGGITVLEVLERMLKVGDFARLREKASSQTKNPSDASAPRSSLFDSKSPLFIPMHPTFVAQSEGAKCQDAMKVVAMSIDKEVWDQIVKGTLSSSSCHDAFAVIAAECKATLFGLKVQHGLKEAKAKDKSKSTMASLALNLQKVRKAAVAAKCFKTNEHFEAMILNKIGEKAKISQSRLFSYFSCK